MATTLLEAVIPGGTVIADKACDTDGIGTFVAAKGAWPDIPPRSMRKDHIDTICVKAQRTAFGAKESVRRRRSLARAAGARSRPRAYRRHPPPLCTDAHAKQRWDVKVAPARLERTGGMLDRSHMDGIGGL
jgi:hypothetical protein